MLKTHRKGTRLYVRKVGKTSAFECKQKCKFSYFGEIISDIFSELVNCATADNISFIKSRETSGG